MSVDKVASPATSRNRTKYCYYIALSASEAEDDNHNIEITDVTKEKQGTEEDDGHERVDLEMDDHPHVEAGAVPLARERGRNQVTWISQARDRRTMRALLVATLEVSHL